MNIEKYTKNEKEAYHFESSEKYCDIEKIKSVRNQLIQNCTLNEVDKFQLEAITKLEIARFNLATRNIQIEEYKMIIGKTVESCKVNYDIFVFDHTKIHDKFYSLLNKEYK